jgi:hypothetical protein
VAPPVPVATHTPEIVVPESAPLTIASAPVEPEAATFETPDHTELVATVDQDVQLEVAAAPTAAVDHWVPIEDATEPSSLALDAAPLASDAEQIIELDDAIDTHHDPVSADAGAVSQSSTLRQGAMAAALAGSVILSRDAHSRPKDSAR